MKIGGCNNLYAELGSVIKIKDDPSYYLVVQEQQNIKLIDLKFNQIYSADCFATLNDLNNEVDIVKVYRKDEIKLMLGV